jgi:hypothetical protein
MFLKFTTTDFLFLLISWVMFHCNRQCFINFRSTYQSVWLKHSSAESHLFYFRKYVPKCVCTRVTWVRQHKVTLLFCGSAPLSSFLSSILITCKQRLYLFCGLLCVCVCVCVCCFPNTSSCPLEVKLDKLFGNKIIIEFCHMQQHFRCWDYNFTCLG